jgi:hypothetical protein
MGGPGKEVGLYALRVFLSRLTDDYGSNPLEGLFSSIEDINTAIIGKTTAAQDTAADLKDVFASLSGFMAVNASFSEAGKKSKEILDGVYETRTLLDRLKDPQSPGSLVALYASITGAQQQINDLNTVEIPNLDPFANKMITFGGSIGRVSATLKQNGIEAVLDNLSKIMKSAQNLDDILNSPIKMDLPAKLTKVAAGLGLNKRFEFKYNQEQIKIDINLNVQMDAAKVEAGILKHGVTIRKGLNQALTDEKRYMTNNQRYMSPEELQQNFSAVDYLKIIPVSEEKK